MSYNDMGFWMENEQRRFAVMADSLLKIEVKPLEKAWLAKALETLRDKLVRNRMKEMAGSEIYALRGKEIDQVNEILNKIR